MLVSVIIPAFNVVDCIGRAIDSALAQSHPQVEVIVVDDASSDATVEYVQRRAAADSRVRLLCNSVNGGPAVARNRGLAAAEGEWLAILDADDAFDPNRTAALCAIAEAQQADLVADNLRFYDAVAGMVTGIAMPDLQPNQVQIIDAKRYFENCITGRSKFDFGQLKAMMRRDFLRRNQLWYPDTLRHGEDFTMYAKVLLAGGRFALVGRPYYDFTERVGRVSCQPSGFSRTTANFEAMRSHTLALLSHPAVERQPSIAVALRKRASAIDWHRRHVWVSGFVKDRNYTALLHGCMRDWRVAVVLGIKLVRRLIPS